MLTKAKARRGQLQIMYDVDRPARLHCTLRCQNGASSPRSAAPRDRPAGRRFLTPAPRAGLVMKYAIDCLDGCETVDSGANAPAMPCQVVLQSAELARLLSAFQPQLEDVRITAFPDGWHEANGSRKPCAVKLESCADVGRIDLYTEVLVPNDSLVHFGIQPGPAFLGAPPAPVSVSTCLKDLKSMAGLCQALEVDIGLSFTRAGMPLVLSTKYRQNVSEHDSDWSAKLVLATLFNREDAALHSQRQRADQGGRRGGAAPPPARGGAFPAEEEPANALAEERLGEVSPSDGADGEELLHFRNDGAGGPSERGDRHHGTSQAAGRPRPGGAHAQHFHPRLPNHRVLVSDSATPSQRTASDAAPTAGRAAKALNALQYDEDFGFDSPMGGDERVSTDGDDDDDGGEFVGASQ